MKKIFIFVLLLLLVPAICLAEPQVTSDKQTFNPFTGVYDLQGNVHVEIGDRIITGDAAQVSINLRYMDKVILPCAKEISPSIVIQSMYTVKKKLPT